MYTFLHEVNRRLRDRSRLCEECGREIKVLVSERDHAVDCPACGAQVQPRQA